MTREQKMDQVIRIFGFENEWVIWFCQVCEDIKATEQMVNLAFTQVLKNA